MLLKLAKVLEKLREVLPRDALSIILDDDLNLDVVIEIRDPDSLILPLLLEDPETYLDEATLCCELEAIRHKVGDHLLEPSPVSEQFHENESVAYVKLNLKPNFFVLGIKRHHSKCGFQNFKHAEILIVELEG